MRAWSKTIAATGERLAERLILEVRCVQFGDEIGHRLRVDLVGGAIAESWEKSAERYAEADPRDRLVDPRRSDPERDRALGRRGGRLRRPLDGATGDRAAAARPAADRDERGLGEGATPATVTNRRQRTRPSPQRRSRGRLGHRRARHDRGLARVLGAVAERSGGWFDRVAGEELGRAYGARLEQQIWAGTGASGQLKGLSVMTGNSSSTVAGQTLANQTAKIADQFQAVATNLGSLPDVIAMAPRRYAGIHSLTAALGLPVEYALPEPVRENIVVSPAAPITLGGSNNEDWIAILNRGAIPLVADQLPQLTFQQQGSTSTAMQWRFVIYAFCALGVSRRPEGVGLVKGTTAPTF